MSLATPQRPLPGAYIQTPAVSRHQTGPPRPVFSRTGSNQQPQNGPQLTQPAQQPPQQQGQVAARPANKILSPIARASTVINENLDQELRYPELDTYVGREYILQPHVNTPDRSQKVSLRNMIFQPKQHGLPFKELGCMLYQTGYSNNTTALKFKQ